MVRSNKDRLNPAEPPPSAHAEQPQQPEPTPATESPLHFVVPTELVDLPSRGQFYPEGHPLHNCETIEIRHMTAKEEDILTSQSLLKKGLALDKMLQSIIVNKKIKVDDLLVGDKNALLIWSRVYGYGPHYLTTITCPACSHKHDHTFNLEDVGNTDQNDALERYDIETTENNTFLMSLPRSGYVLEFKLLTNKEEKNFLGTSRDNRSLRLLEAVTVAVNNQTDRFYIKRALSSLPIMDAAMIKRVYARVMPDLDLSQEVDCPNCAEVTTMEVPLDANFFWPDI